MSVARSNYLINRLSLFQVYKSSLPTAISTRDFGRVLTLASIGKTAGSGEMLVSTNGKALHHWKRQSKFVSQCEELALRAKWWNVLQKHNVKFDPRRFQEGRQVSGGDNPKVPQNMYLH
jgi:hypothetical protein